MNVMLPQDLEQYVESLVRTGTYAGCNDVIQEALRQHQVNRPGFDVVMTPELEKVLDEGMYDLDHAKTTEELRRRP
jgi:Arc/MetJ-type ribon-helix-helix transcriptional regulator